uniref:Transposase n=1 Tax=Candidatus Nitrotoga fabula TaxID=2182327 RepID=A0A2X0QT50_9PROT|nr:conserved protein of unknown function [Candidatus Nitrotoga fabula]
MDEATETAVIAFATDYPALGQLRASNELRKTGIFVSPSGVRSIWLRHGLASFKQRLVRLEQKVADEGIILIEAQVQALEKKRDDDTACGEIETVHPGYLGSQDTFYLSSVLMLVAQLSKPVPLTFASAVSDQIATTTHKMTASLSYSWILQSTTELALLRCIDHFA